MVQGSKGTEPQQVKYYSNCLFWATWQKIRYGGKLNFYKSNTWKGFHVTWTNLKEEEWEYTILDQHKRKWWYYPILFKGIVRKRRH